ncbi:hypothetical protein NQ318_003196 [Aromia moschata]|uniref:Uncharacterized protein n=1 Tax=Aromia moschata TaxID=1265417 RepID=A0AAV8YGK6_9CUCU|nr:hypothetical protein NQ318_003196 [Aromia moschata]
MHEYGKIIIKLEIQYVNVANECCWKSRKCLLPFHAAEDTTPNAPDRGTAERTLILISRQTKITTCKCLECKRTAETFGHQNT